MSYHVYTTDGIVLKRTPFGEANILLHILTEDLGLIMASARSARLSVSKLRPSLQEYAYISISCINGKNGWKVTNALEKENFFFEQENLRRKILAQVSLVVLKMIPGESPHREVFQTMKTGFIFLKSVDEKNISNFEMLAILRILYQLGYVARDKEIEDFVKEGTFWSVEILEQIGQNKKQVVDIINKALKESHL